MDMMAHCTKHYAIKYIPEGYAIKYIPAEGEIICVHCLREENDDLKARLEKAETTIEELTVDLAIAEDKLDQAEAEGDRLRAAGWPDPKPAPEEECQVPRCHKQATCGTPTPDGYKRLCGPHFKAAQCLGAEAE